MYRLVAGSTAPEWSGETASETFESLDAARKCMRQWALFGVDAYCNNPDLLWITDESGEPVSYWDWRSRAARTPEPEGTDSAPASRPE